MAQMVNCVKLGLQLPGLEKPPFPGELGDRILENISKQAWEMWGEQQVILINHHGLVLADPEARQFLIREMEDFLFGSGAKMPAGWTAEGEGGTRVVNCVKLGRPLPGLEDPPFGGELGDRIFDNVSQQAWEMWKEHQVILINHNGLVLADPNARQFLMEQLEEFFFGEGARMPDDWTPEGTQGGGGKGGGPARKK